MKWLKDSDIGFQDVLFNPSLGILVLFILAVILINPVAETGEIEYQAEFVIIATWAEGSRTDIDLWANAPKCGVVSFRRKETCLMTLDRDDLGRQNDMGPIVDGVRELKLVI